ncbi:DMT family transporter [Trichothermofontia sp.]
MLGFLLVLAAAFCFCLQNVIVRVLFTEQTLFGLFPTGGFVTPTLPHSFLLLFMRMAIVVPLMAALATTLYPATWRDMQVISRSGQRFLLGRSLAGGGLMFLYLALLYVSVGLIPTGIALTLFFTYPVFTALIAWYTFGSSPSPQRWGIMGLILVGTVLTLPHSRSIAGVASPLGILCGITAGFAYALYTINAQQSFVSLHPVPFTWISFAVTLLLSAGSLSLGPHAAAPLSWWPLWVGGGFSAIVTLAGHLLNNLGIRQIGATTAAIIGASNPALTVVLAWLAIQEHLNGVQLTGVAIVTLGVLFLSRDTTPQREKSTP